MIPREILKKLRQIELRTNRPVSGTLLVLFALSAIACRRPESSNLPSSVVRLYKGQVEFRVPQRWIIQQRITNGQSEIIQFEVPDRTTEHTPDSANAGITVEPLQPGVTVTNFGDARLFKGTLAEGNAVLTDFIADASWRSVLSRGQQGLTPYIIMDRFGVDQGVMVTLRIAHPLLPNNGGELAQSVSNFNFAVGSLKIGGTNTIDSEMRMDKGAVWLRHFSDSETNWMSKTGVVWRTFQPSQP